MGHMAAKDVYRRLGKKIDGLQVRTPWNETFSAMLHELYTEEEASLVAAMPNGLSTFERVKKITKRPEAQLRRTLEGLCLKGLVMDLWVNEEYHYIPSPLLVGIFELTMMRTGGNLDTKKCAKLFHDYFGSFYAGNLANREHVSIIRALPHEEAIAPSAYTEVLDYEKASLLVESNDRFSIGLCSCRHEKHHVGEKACDIPFETCSSFGYTADFMIRNNLAREVSKSEMHDNLARSRELGLVLNADNVRKNITFLCHCCKCCCNALRGISTYGYSNAVITSTLMAEPDKAACVGCGKCSRACPVNGIDLVPVENPEGRRKKRSRVDESLCLGCGVCALHCRTGAMKLIKRGKRVLHPETSFERVILMCLERGTLQNQLFDNPQSVTQDFMRGVLGGFLRLSPVKRALMSDTLRSTFLAAMKRGARLQGRGYLTEM